jgi:glycosyltransferase involved in cell wall biosynthesis
MITQSMLVGYGVGEVADMLAKEITKLGYEVTLITGQTESSPKEYDLIMLKPLRLPLVCEYWQANFLTDIRLTLPALRELKGSDVVVTFDPMHFTGMLAKRFLRLPVFMYYFGIVPPNVLSSPGRKAEALRQRLLWHQSFRFSDVVMTNSKYTFNMLPQALRRKAVVNYHGVDHLLSTYAEAHKREFRKKLGLSDKKIILSIGRFSTPYKGIKTMVKIFKRMRAKREDIVLLLLGRNAGGEMFGGIAGVRAFTNVPKQFLVQCLASCDLYASASLWEGFNIPLAATQANGKPAVVFNVGAHPEVLVDGRTGFLASTPTEFVERLDMLIENDELRRRMGEEASRHAMAFSWESCTKTLTRLISSLSKTAN